MSETNKLEIVLGYQFKDLSFSRALTHKSFAADDNERLEFLGDAVLGLMVSDLLYAHFPEYSEGQLSMIKSYMVSKKFLHRIANALNLESQIRFNRENPKKSQAVLANTVEALIGAIFLDSDYKTTLSIMAPSLHRTLMTLILLVLKTQKTHYKNTLNSALLSCPSAT